MAGGGTGINKSRRRLFVSSKEIKQPVLGYMGITYLQTTQAKPISMAKSSALVSSKLERSAIAKSLLVWTVMGEDRVSGFSNLGFFGISTPSVTSFIYKKNVMMNDPESNMA